MFFFFVSFAPFVAKPRTFELLNAACPVKFIEDKERSGFNWGTSEPF
jgi:hypothetical protein